jgi:hypothetical protein
MFANPESTPDRQFDDDGSAWYERRMREDDLLFYEAFCIILNHGLSISGALTTKYKQVKRVYLEKLRQEEEVKRIKENVKSALKKLSPEEIRLLGLEGHAANSEQSSYSTTAGKSP